MLWRACTFYLAMNSFVQLFTSLLRNSILRKFISCWTAPSSSGNDKAAVTLRKDPLCFLLYLVKNDMMGHCHHQEKKVGALVTGKLQCRLPSAVYSRLEAQDMWAICFVPLYSCQAAARGPWIAQGKTSAVPSNSTDTFELPTCMITACTLKVSIRGDT